MIEKARRAFNNGYKEEYYENLQKEISDAMGEACSFRISETPVFISREVKKEIFSACEAIIEQLGRMNFEEIRDRFVSKKQQSSAPMGKPHFLAIDFGLCDDGNGGITPKLIELQAFPTLFFYQPFLGKSFLKTYPTIPKEGFHYYFSNLNEVEYLQEVKEVILGNENVENVILMELFPEKQKTRVDFWATRNALGIEVVCMTKIVKEGKQLFYEKEGRKIQINRIYNRVILDELVRIKDLKVNFKFSDDTLC